MATGPRRTIVDPTGYVGNLRFLEVMIGSKARLGSGLWMEAGHLTTLTWDAAFATREPLKDSHGQIAHYARSFELFDKDDPERAAELFERLDLIAHLADFHVDIDNAEPDASRKEAVRLVKFYLDLGVPEQAIGIRFSGSKGFHVTLPWQVLGVAEQGMIGLNYATYRALGARLADELKLKGVDAALWRRNGTIRLENTRHPTSGLCKVRLTYAELKGSMSGIKALAEQPRKPLYDDATEIAVRQQVVGAHRLYLTAQAEADAEIARVTELRHRDLPDEVLAKLQGRLTPCLDHLLSSAPAEGNRNESLFHAGMMLKHTGASLDEALSRGQAWLGSQWRAVGGEATMRSAYRGPFAGGCRWMRDAGYADKGDCARCPIGQRRFERPARLTPEKVTPEAPTLPSIAEQRKRLEADLEDLSPNHVTVISTPAGLGKSHAVLRRAARIAEDGGRSLVFVKDTRKVDGLAADMIRELRDVHGYDGKVRVLYGRDQDNCENWQEASEVQRKGYSVGREVCSSCFARHYCDYFAQYDTAYEPGIYIAPHAMLPIIFADSRRGFDREFVQHTDEEGVTYDVGGPLSLIVIDEDALDVLIERYFIGEYHLKNELRHVTRFRRDPLTGLKTKKVRLDRNYLKLVEWAQSAIRVKGPFMPALRSVAAAEGFNVAAIVHAINPSRILDPDRKAHRGHKPFTERFYLALVREVGRLKDGNYTIWSTGSGLEILKPQRVAFPPNIPVAVLDAYANEDVYRRYFRAASLNRLPTFRAYPTREQANVTYVLGVNLLQSDLERAKSGNRYADEKITKLMRSLRVLTSDGIETYLVAKRAFFESEAWAAWKDKLPNCVESGAAGTLYFWRGRGINQAAGKRIAIIQVPNFHPVSVLAEASVLFADEPRLDDQRQPVEVEVPWAAAAREPRRILVDRTEYADARLNLINERYRSDELVQMALRSRSLTTGAQIIVFADLPDPRLPAAQVYTADELVARDTIHAGEARRTIYEALAERGALSIENLTLLGVVGGRPQGSALRTHVKDRHPDAYRVAVQHAVDEATARKEIGA